MSTKKDSLGNTKNTEAINHELGRLVGSAITAAFAAPPTSPEAAKETREAMIQTALGAEENGASRQTLAFYSGVIEAIEALIKAGEIHLHMPSKAG